MAAYRTRSNTQKLQRLIEFLKERDCDSAANLEASAEVFLNDVKPKAHIDGIPHYDGTESDDGSSYVEEADDKSDKDDGDWGSDWEEEEWEDCTEEQRKTEIIPTPLPSIEKTPSPLPKEITPPPTPPPKENSPPLDGWRRR